MNASMPTGLPKGIQRVTSLPDDGLAELWDSIIMEDKEKERLLSQAVLNFTMHGKVSRSVLPLHGVILLVGAPGTGKTSLAKGLASQISNVFQGEKFRLVEVDAHGLMSSSMGKSQKEVSGLFDRVIAEYAMEGPIIVLLDEVETLAVDRSRLSMDANPIDIHRSTDAVLVKLDLLAEENSNLLFVATSNFPEAVDSAFVSRCDLVLNMPLPDAEACQKILKSTLEGLGVIYPKLADLTKSKDFASCASMFKGLDGRAIRKTVSNALASSKDTAIEPEKLTLSHLKSAAASAMSIRKGEGK